MKHSFLFLFTQFLITISGFNTGAIAQSKNENAATVNKKLDSLLDQKEYFRLETELNRLSNSLDEKQTLYFQCFVDNAFNHNKESIARVDDLLKKYFPGLSDSLKAALLLLQGDSYFKIYNYSNAANCDSLVIARYPASIDSSLLSDTKNDLLIRQALRDVPPQEAMINNGTTLNWKKDGMGLMNIPVTFNHEDHRAVFDTKANISCITESYASRLGLRLLHASIEVGSGMTGIKFNNDLGVADSFYIGDILVRNAVFLVMPDKMLRFGPFSINIIIGYPVIEQLKEIQIYKDGRMIIPVKPAASDLHNFALDGLSPVLQLRTGNDTLCFHLDLGAVKTNLYSTYFEKYKDIILRDGKKTTIKLGGAGGSAKKDIYNFIGLDLSIDNNTVSFKNVNIFTEKTTDKERLYGNLGQDFTRQFDGFILNFKYMYFKVQ